jgi:GntR family transcriptional repressor for pyruvate dehydrogenase complex
METLGEQLSWLIKPDRKTLSDLWEVRKYIELGISHVAAQKATDQDFNDLDQMIEEMEAAVDDFEAYFPLGTDFHKKLALITGNRFFYIIWSMIQDIMLKGYTPILRELFPEGPMKLCEVNKQIVDALRSRNPGIIDDTMEIHAIAEAVFNNNQEKGEEK